jgi:hypothetical protein
MSAAEFPQPLTHDQLEYNTVYQVVINYPPDHPLAYENGIHIAKIEYAEDGIIHFEMLVPMSNEELNPEYYTYKLNRGYRPSTEIPKYVHDFKYGQRTRDFLYDLSIDDGSIAIFPLDAILSGPKLRNLMKNVAWTRRRHLIGFRSKALGQQRHAEDTNDNTPTFNPFPDRMRKLNENMNGVSGAKMKEHAALPAPPTAFVNSRLAQLPRPPLFGQVYLMKEAMKNKGASGTKKAPAPRRRRATRRRRGL